MVLKCLRLGVLLTGVLGCMAQAPVFAADAADPEVAIGQLLAQAQALEHGEGVPRDPEQAADLYCQAVLLGSGEAMYSLAWMFANGRGVARNDDYAITLLDMAIVKGHAGAERIRPRFGEFSGAVPECLKPRPSDRQFFARESWDSRKYIASLPEGRRQMVEMVTTLAGRYAIEPRLALAIASTESALDPNARSPKNAMGVMQLIPETAARFNVKDSFDPVQNIRGGLAYLRWLLAYYKGNVALAAAGYNAGEGAVDKYKGIPPYKETQAYVKRILAFFPRAEHPFDPSAVPHPSPIVQELKAAGALVVR
jgi:TPR repeat protein